MEDRGGIVFVFLKIFHEAYYRIFVVVLARILFIEDEN